MYRKNNESMFTIRDVDVQYHCVSIRNNFSKYIIASSLIEPVIKFVERSQADLKLYYLLSDSIKVLDKLVPQKGEYLLSMYDTQFLSVQGYSPDLDACIKCGLVLKDNKAYSDYNNGFPLCEICKIKSSTFVNAGAYEFFKWAKVHPVENAKKIKMKDSTLVNVRAVIEHLYLYTFHSTPKSWKQLKECFPLST